jgi:nickel transport protein
MTASKIAILAVFLLFLLPQPGRAHALRLFAAAEGTAVHGSVYFPGGGSLPGASVAAYGQDGRLLARTTTDGDGRFILPAGDRGTLLLVAETADGHRTEFTLAAQGPAGGPPPAEPPPTATQADHELLPLIEEAVARQLRPLREQLDREAQRRRLQDVLGGLGYILGIAGLAMYWAARKRTRGKDQPR